jgi:GNAT superfamily N-acetyltransferase
MQPGLPNMVQEFEGLILQTVADEPSLVDEMQGLHEQAWPRFVLESRAPRGHPLPWDWMSIYRRWPTLQIGLRDPESGALVALANGLALAWDGRADDLPDTGWNWALVQGEQDHTSGLSPVTGCALAVTIDPARRGENLSSVALRALAQQCRQMGLRRLIAPVRPIWKARYPITPMRVFCRWTNEAGLPLDPWLRVHVRLGATVVKACDHSQPLAAPVAAWEAWLGLPLPTSGDYVAPGLLAPLHVDRAADEAVCVEANVWVEHPRL